MMMTIDGSHGEGGGQVLRTSLSMAAVLRRDVEIINIRANRKKPGLMPQHLCACRAVAAVTGGRLEGDRLGSARLRFSPLSPRHGRYRFDVSEAKPSAGSTGMIFQTLLPPLALAGASTRLKLLGGTHTPWSPPVHYLQEVFLPALILMGLRTQLSLRRWGWYPRGGGIVEAQIEPAGELRAVDLTRRGSLLEVWGLSAVARLPRSIAERQRHQAISRLAAKAIKADLEVQEVPSRGPGTFIILVAHFENLSAGFSALGKKGRPAEAVADEAVDAFLAHERSQGAVDPHLSDQLLLYMLLAQGTSRLTSSSITPHLLTNVWVLEQFLPGRIRVQGREGEEGAVVVEGVGFRARRDA
jgi:RNA 3'-terminal phosphate cyclase (ATP)